MVHTMPTIDHHATLSGVARGEAHGARVLSGVARGGKRGKLPPFFLDLYYSLSSS